MTGARWEQVVALFEQSLEQPAALREQFVEAAAGHDHDLRSQVLAMLRADSSGHAMLDSSRGASADTVPGVPTTAPVEGQQIGSYSVVREIGRGGMASVYLATDAKHRRAVALKLLNVGASSVLGGVRFRREIEVVAQLRHPHILPLYDSGATEGRLFYVMPFVTGETLRQRIAREGQLSVAFVRRIAAEVGDALDYAHRRGVIHRDVKPANILLDEEHAVVADFGIAQRALEDSADPLTAAGMVIGTPAYMSPEQALGQRELDARSDIYGLGCVVYEMLAGVPPFRAATTPALVLQHLRAPIPSVVAVRPSLSPATDAVLQKALAKDPAERFASAREFVESLDAALGLPSGERSSPVVPSTALLETTAPPPESVVAQRPSGRRRVLAALGAMLVLAAVAAGVIATGDAPPPSVAVLPFDNLSPDQANEYFSDGVTEELIGALSQLGRIRVTPRTTVFAYKGRTGDMKSLGAELGVTHIIEGSAQRDADTVLVRAALYNARTGERLWFGQYKRDWSSMLALQAEIAGEIAGQLELNLLPGERARLSERHTVNADAYDSYLRGRHFFDVRTAASLEQAVVHFQRALAIDSLYARAHAGLADTYSILAWTGSGVPTELFARAEAAARRALSLDSTLAEAHVSLGIIHTFHHWDWPAADRATSRAIALDSTLASAWFFRTWHLVAQGRLPEAVQSIERARQLEPLSLITNARVGTLLGWTGQYAAADSALQRTLEIDPAYPVARVQRARVLSIQGRHDEAIEALPPDSVRLGSYESGIAGFVYARAGRREAALASARALEAREYIPGEGVAVIHAALGDTATALAWLERAVDSRGVGLIFVGVEPVYEPLRAHPRFRRVVERIGLER